MHTGRKSKNDSNPIQISEYISTRVDFTVSTFCIIWKYHHLCHDVHIEHFKKLDLPNIYKYKKNIPIIFVFINVWLLKFYKKFNMDIKTKMVHFQIIQKVFNVKFTLGNIDDVKCLKRNFSFWPYMIISILRKKFSNFRECFIN